jgi:hypothetical protein
VYNSTCFERQALIIRSPSPYIQPPVSCVCVCLQHCLVRNWLLVVRLSVLIGWSRVLIGVKHILSIFVASCWSKISCTKLATCVMNKTSMFETSLLPSVRFVFHSAKTKNSCNLLDIWGCVNCIFLVVNFTWMFQPTLLCSYGYVERPWNECCVVISQHINEAQ